MTEKPIGHGTVLAGRFRLEDLVHDTDGARFWRATDQTLARNVAVNVIDRADPRAEALLVAARTSATVTEGHFLRVLDAAEADGVVYVVHEWGTGDSLDKMLAEGPLPPRRAAWLVKEVAEAITVAHGHGIAHGRLLPENVMVTEAGSVKLIGFLVDAVLHGRHNATTPDGRTLSDHESDVLNLAALLYAALTDKWPGTPGTSLPDAPRDRGRPLRPRQVRAGVPRPLDAICEQVLNPGSTVAVPVETAHEICAALSDFIGDPVGAGLRGAEATAVIDREQLPGWSPPASADGTDLAPDRPTADPEATQAGEPMFLDDEEHEWTSGAAHVRTAGPPPPPLPPLPDAKPLFAPGPPRAEDPRAATGPGTSGPTVPPGSGPTRSHHGTGSLPPVWGPDADAAAAGDSRWAGRDAGGDWLKLAAAVAVVLVLVLAVIVAFRLGRGAEEDPTVEPSAPAQSPTAVAEPLTVAGVSDLDPPPAGNGEENPDLAPLAVDGNPSTAWETMEYFRDPRLGRLKDGVGLVVDLGGAEEVSRVDLRLQGEPTSLDVYAAPEGSDRPGGIEGLTKVATANGAGTSVRLDLDQPVTTQYLVVWLTSLPPADGNFRGRVAEIVVRP